MSDVEGVFSKIGKRGEIFTTKRIREIVGLKPGSPIKLIAKSGELMVKKIPSIEELLSEEPLVTLSPEEAEEISEKMQKEISSHIFRDVKSIE